jgi:hypothetical protein
MANIVKCARSTAVMNKVRGGNPFVFNSRFIGYDEKAEGILAQQREADRRLREIQAKKVKTGCNIVNGLRYKEARDFKETHDSVMSTMKQATFNQKVWGQV